ncbi:GNAT family N-acetyltransferase [Streptomyces canus]|uniref:GNAT family N-acetyltransferase n=1 Tax=Streptomyces canus TaxID=58343 RepID=UPI0032524D8C
MKYVIRRITAEEWRELRAIRLESLLDSPDAFGVRHADAVALSDRTWREQAERAAADDGLFVAINETGSWAGTAGVAPLDGIPDTAHVHAVYVAPAHRGPDGPARALMEAAVDFAREHTDCTWLTLGVREDNHRAMAFYRHIGFHDLGKTVPYPLYSTKFLRILVCPDFRVSRVPDIAPTSDINTGFPVRSYSDPCDGRGTENPAPVGDLAPPAPTSQPQQGHHALPAHGRATASAGSGLSPELARGSEPDPHLLPTDRPRRLDDQRRRPASPGGGPLRALDRPKDHP